MALSFRSFDDSLLSLYKRFSVRVICKHVELFTVVATGNEISDSFVGTQVLILDL